MALIGGRACIEPFTYITVFYVIYVTKKFTPTFTPTKCDPARLSIVQISGAFQLRASNYVQLLRDTRQTTWAGSPTIQNFVDLRGGVSGSFVGRCRKSGFR